MTITNGLITAATLANFTGYPASTNPTKTADVDAAIETASRVIEQHCKREFHATASSARYFDTRDGATVVIDDATAITSVHTDTGDDGTYAQLVASSLYQLLPVGGWSRNLGAGPYTMIKALQWNTWPITNKRVGAVKVTATWGWAEVPVPVQRACALLAFDLLRDREANYAGVAVTAEGVAIFSRMPRRVADLVAPYVRHERGGLA